MGPFARIVRVSGFLALVFTTVFAAAPAVDAKAGTTHRQAVVHVGGSDLTIDLTMDSVAARSVTGPVQIVVTTPGRGRAYVASTDDGFNGQGYSISFVRGDAGNGAVSVAVTVPARARTWTEVGVASPEGFASAAPGKTNRQTVVVSYI